MRKLIKLSAVLLVLAAAVLCLSVPTFATETEKSSAQQTYMTMEEAVVELREAMERRESPITVVFRSAEPESEEMAETVFYSAIAHTGVPTEGDYLYRHISGLKFHCESEALEDGYLSTATYTITYRTTAAQEAQVTEKITQILDRLDVYDSSDYEKVQAIYDYLCSHITTPVFTGSSDYTAYGALVKESAVCHGFSTAFYRLALELGVDNRLISGKVGTVNHGWNIVSINGRYYNVDATKDAGFDPEEYNYFLKSAYSTHVRDQAYDTEEFHGNYPMTDWDYVPHDPVWDEGSVTKEPTGYEEGVKTYTCTLCGETKEESLPRNGWELSGDRWRFYENGALATGWIKWKNIWYYLDDSGVMKTGWIQWNHKWYYLNASGAMQTGWIKPGAVWYYLNTNGAMQTGWIKPGTVWYYMNTNGAMLENSWVLWNSAWYFLDDSGVMKTGWLKWKNVWYYLQEDGAMATGTVEIESKTYQFSASGAWIP